MGFSKPNLSPEKMYARHYRGAAYAACLILGGLLAGCSSDGSAPVAAPAATAMKPSSQPKAVHQTDVSKVQAWRDAEIIAGRGENRASVVGSGESMKPVYGDNTVLVINKIAYEDLKTGMTVAYLNARGHQVVHQLLVREAGGWRVQGLNNETEDRECVTRENLIGVVYASFASGEDP